MWQYVIVGAIVLLAALAAGRMAWKALRGRGSCACGQRDACPFRDVEPDAPKPRDGAAPGPHASA